MQHHANLPLAGLLHDQPVGDVTHFTGSRADALCDFLTHALFVVQSTVYRARDTPQRSAICCIVTIKSLSCVICTYTISHISPVHQMLHVHENDVPYILDITMIAVFLCDISINIRQYMYIFTR